MFYEGIGAIKGIGPVKKERLAHLGIFTVADMLYCFPRSFEDRGNFKKIFELQDGEKASVLVCPAGEMSISRIKKNMTVSKQNFSDGSGILTCTWFNNPYLKNTFIKGRQYSIFGKVKAIYAKKEMNSPIFEKAGENKNTGRIVPIYALTAGLTARDMTSAAEKCLAASKGCIPETIPDDIKNKYNLAAIDYSMRNIHFPQNNESFMIARRRFVFEEFFVLRCGLALAKSRKSSSSGIPLEKLNPNDFFSLLPFSPTNAQRRAVNEIFCDLKKETPMNRLVQGDVGSGKTAVACAALYAAAINGFQSALMAPTEILAVQHFESLSKLFPQYNIVLLKGSQTPNVKKKNYEEILSGAAQIVIGTHALITDKVEFKNLAVVVTDEQHRFGVKQRGALTEKGQNPHLLVMSATPIPRTLSHVIYGDLDVSIIDELPPGRQKTDTFFVKSALRDRAYGFVLKQLAFGSRAYIVCPMAEESETLDVKNVIAHTKMISEKYFKGFNVAYIHGKMKTREKDEIMEKFSRGSIDVLVSTTVIEVGVNVPEANIMVIENAERFGLSQLHQLRGRVGRGSEKSYCIMISDTDSPLTKKRLKTMTETCDGFKISEEDLKLRGPGDFFGTRQHGLPELRIANIFEDMPVLKEACAAADELLSRDKFLTSPESINLRKRISVLFGNTVKN